MTVRTTALAVFLTVLALLALAACGGSPPAALADIPSYPGAVELKPGESNLADTLANNNQADAALRGQIGVGGAIEQKGYSLPDDATWDQVKSFYDQKLQAGGWTTNSMVSGIMDQVNQGNELFRTANWQRGSQNVSVVMLTSPTDAAQKELIISLSSQ
jgi:hypothetical protein